MTELSINSARSLGRLCSCLDTCLRDPFLCKLIVYHHITNSCPMQDKELSDAR